MISRIACEKCQSRLKYDSERMGKVETCPCPKCGATVRLPGPASKSAV